MSNTGATTRSQVSRPPFTGPFDSGSEIALAGQFSTKTKSTPPPRLARAAPSLLPPLRSTRPTSSSITPVQIEAARVARELARATAYEEAARMRIIVGSIWGLALAIAATLGVLALR